MGAAAAGVLRHCVRVPETGGDTEVMAQAGGAHGGDVWVQELERLIAEEPEPPDVPTAIGPLAQLGVDVGAVQATNTRSKKH